MRSEDSSTSFVMTPPAAALGTKSVVAVVVVAGAGNIAAESIEC